MAKFSNFFVLLSFIALVSAGCQSGSDGQSKSDYVPMLDQATLDAMKKDAETYRYMRGEDLERLKRMSNAIVNQERDPTTEEVRYALSVTRQAERSVNVLLCKRLNYDYSLHVITMGDSVPEAVREEVFQFGVRLSQMTWDNQKGVMPKEIPDTPENRKEVIDSYLFQASEMLRASGDPRAIPYLKKLSAFPSPVDEKAGRELKNLRTILEKRKKGESR
ncbi:MAG: hypothetical protein SFU56_00350 [Capsulimonadales bacterium]|nr:hypothetical protein [Capsulimonadales bacterium]